MVGPAWLYVFAAASILAVAVVFAVVRTSSGGAAAPNPPLSGGTSPPAAVSTGDRQESPQQPAAQRAAAVPPPQTAARPPEPEQQTGAQSQPSASPPQASRQPQQSQPQPVESSAAADPDALSGFIVPIVGACVTEYEGHLPGAPRAYRNNGVHEGLDFYEWASCTAINLDTPILAAKAGVVVRADLDYVDVTPADWARFEAAGFEGEAILDELRGRQIWIEHEGGIITRYAHLNRIAAGIGVGVHIDQGRLIGYPGESGQRESYDAPGTDIHLHFEIRVGDSWLGAGLSPLEARSLYLQAFGLLSE